MVRKFIIDADVGMDDASAIFIAAEAHKAGVIAERVYEAKL